MAKKIVFTYNDTEYVLEYTRKAIERMEADGFVVDEIAKKPMTMLPKMFKYAFLANHSELSICKIEEILSLFTDKAGMIEQLSVMYGEAVNTLFGEPVKNAIQWKKVA